MKTFLLASAALFCAGSSVAQEVATAPPQESTGSTASLLDEIIVTATKRGYGENVQDVPMAITAFGAAQLDAKFVQDLQGLSYEVPNVQLEDVGTAPGYANFTIRGLGINSTIPSIDPTVGVFVDGIYLGINAGVVLDNFDLEGVEILRGPQGLLFGRNVTGGAVVVRTTRPSFDRRANAEASIESGPKVTASATLTGPIVDDVLAMKLAVYYSEDDGYFHNSFTDSQFGKSKNLIIRPALSFQASDSLRMDLRYEHGEVDADGPPFQSHAIFPRNSTFDISINFPGFYKADWDQAIFETNLDVGFGDGVLTNIAGYRQFSSRSAGDLDGTPLSFFHAYFSIDQSQFSNELRYAGTFGDFEVTSGLYYFTQDLNYAELRELLGGTRVISGGGTQDQTTWGVFVSTDWHLTDKLTINLGGRYTWERKEAAVGTLGADQCNLDTVTCAVNFADNASWEGFTPKIGLQWEPDEDTQIYGLYTRGFRSGGYNLRNTDPAVPPGPFDQETQDSFEIGAKKQIGPHRANIAIFHNTVNDLQREIIVPGPLGVSQVIRNTADAEFNGVEAEGQFLLLSSLVLTAQLGYTDGEYTDVRFDLTGDGVVNSTDLALELPRLSPWTYGAGLTYDRDAGSWGTVTARVNYTYRDGSAFTDNNVGFLDESEMVDASLTLNTGANWRLSVYGRNLLDEVTIGGDTPLSAAFGGVGASLSPLNRGRVFGAEVAARF